MGVAIADAIDKFIVGGVRVVQNEISVALSYVRADRKTCPDQDNQRRLWNAEMYARTRRMTPNIKASLLDVRITALRQ